MNEEYEIEETEETEDLDGFGFDERFDLDGFTMGTLDREGYGSMDDYANGGGIDFG